MYCRGISRRCRRVAALSALLAATWVSRGVAQENPQPENWDAGLKLAEAVDRNPDPHIVEIDLQSRVAQVAIGPDRRVEMWTYDGGLPGPLIRIRVGDRLIVHFSNALPAPTTVHWHGLRVPVQMDGVPGASQPEVKPGESFTYDFVVPDAGLYWYHPHVMSAAQVGFGLYGALLVEDPAERLGVSDELVLVLSDVAIGDKGTLEDPDGGGTLAMAFGREGNHNLVNGREAPALLARDGAPQRWRIVNAAKSRYFKLYLEGHRFTIVGGDSGLQEFPVESETLLIIPGERFDVIITPHGPPGREMSLTTIPVNRGFGSAEFRSLEDLFTIRIADAPTYVAAPLPQIKRSIEPLSTEGATAVKIDFTLTQQLPEKTIEYGINGVAFAKDRPIKASLGETQVWTLNNKTPWSHPFHLHGFFFQVLDDKGVPVSPRAWKDTANVPMEQSLRIVVRFDDRPGSWMYHCHILDHADGGLMGMVELGGISTSHDKH